MALSLFANKRGIKNVRNDIRYVPNALSVFECKKLIKQYKQDYSINFGTKHRSQSSTHRSDVNRGVQYLHNVKNLKHYSALAHRDVKNLYVTVVACGVPPTGNVGWHSDSFVPRDPHMQVCTTLLVGLNDGHGGDLLFRSGLRYKYKTGSGLIFNYSHEGAGKNVRYGKRQHRSLRMYKPKYLLTVMFCKKRYVNNAWTTPHTKLVAKLTVRKHRKVVERISDGKY